MTLAVFIAFWLLLFPYNYLCRKLFSAILGIHIIVTSSWRERNDHFLPFLNFWLPDIHDPRFSKWLPSSAGRIKFWITLAENLSFLFYCLLAIGIAIVIKLF